MNASKYIICHSCDVNIKDKKCKACDGTGIWECWPNVTVAALKEKIKELGRRPAKNSSRRSTSSRKMAKFNIFSGIIAYRGGGVDYDTTNCTGECGDYCRCSKIINTRIKSFDYGGVIKAILSEKFDLKNFKHFFLERFVRIVLYENPDDFAEVLTCRGYYGEEIDGIEIDHGCCQEINNFVHLLNKKSCKSSEIVETCLIKEYGYVLESLKNKQWEIKSVALNKISVGNEYRKLDEKTIERYKEDDSLLGCVCESSKDGLRLIDGYHRFLVAKQIGKRKIIVVSTKELQNETN